MAATEGRTPTGRTGDKAMSARHQTIPAPATTPPPHRAPSLPTSALVTRLIRPGIDSAKRRIRARLLLLSDAHLQSGLGLSKADIGALRGAGLADSLLAGAQHEPVRLSKRALRPKGFKVPQRASMPKPAPLNARLPAAPVALIRA